MFINRQIQDIIIDAAADAARTCIIGTGGYPPKEQVLALMRRKVRYYG